MEGGFEMQRKGVLKTKRFCRVSFLLILFITCPLNLFGQEDSQENILRVEAKDNLISMDVKNAELADVLKEIEKSTGIKMTVSQELIGKKMSFYSENLDIEDVLKEILHEYLYVLTFSQDPVANKNTLKDVRVQSDVIGSKPYKGKMITVDIPYGSGVGQVGTVNEGEGAIIGPKSFTVDDEGTIYVCDTVNTRVQIFNSNGNYLSTIPLKTEAMAEDIAVDDSGFIYIYDQLGKLYQYDKKGTLVSKIAVDVNRLPGGGAMHAINSEIYVYACDDHMCEDFIIGRTSLDNLLIRPSDEEAKIVKEKGKQGLSRKKYMTGLNKTVKGDLEINDKDRASLKIMSLPIREILSIEFLGEDIKGNLFIKTDRDDENKKLVSEVHKLNAKGDYLRTNQMPESDISYWSVRNYAISENGTLYQFLPEKDKLRLNIFPSVDQ
jgi:hypothetical protein